MSDGDTDSNDASVIPDANRPDEDATTPPTDSGNDATTPETCEPTGTTCSGPLTQAGWTPVVVPQANAACPDGFQTVDLVTNPVAENGACTCGPMQVTEPSCATNPAYRGRVGDDCNSLPPQPNGTIYVVSGDTCMPFSASNGSTLAAVATYEPIPKSGDGSCTSQQSKDASHLKTDPLRLCTPTPACVEHTCATEDTATAKVCVAHDGEASCPSAFPKKLTNAAASATLECSPCGCKVTGECGDAVLSYYSDLLCFVESASRVVDGTCHPLSGNGATPPKSYRYKANPQFEGQMTTSSVATTGLDTSTSRTICCR